MEAAEGERTKSPDGAEKRPKRKMKTAYQLELLEKTYAVSTYPSESLRAELSTKLGLSDRQLQMWFCHRRLKDRKANEMAVTTSAVTPLPEPRKAVARMSSSSPALARIEADMQNVKMYYEAMHPPLQPAQTMLEMQAISFVESQLGGRIREDGPILGMEFDPLPPGAFGAPIVAETTGQQNQMGRPYDGKMFDRHDSKASKNTSFLPSMEHCFMPSSSSHSGGKRKAATAGSLIVHSQGAGARALQEYQFLPEQPTVRSEAYEKLPSSHFYDSSVDNISARVSPLSTPGPYLHGNEHVSPGYALQGQTSSGGYHAQQGRQHVYASSSERIIQEDDALRVDRKRKGEEARIAKEVEAHEKRIRRELEKQDVLRRKREEQIRKEMERHDRERRKEEERLMRERQREEERFQREQKRECERREKFLQKENRRAEKIRRKEEVRREKEAARIKAAHERAAARRIAREHMELIEDERLELMELAALKKGISSIVLLDSDALQNMDSLRETLSPFPPMPVRQHFKRPFSVQPWADSDDNVGNLLMVWKFLITFADVLGLWPFTLDEFVQAFHDYDPRLLGEIHIALLKSIIKDIEDVARTPAVSAGANQSSTANPVGGHPHIVEGAYAWGFDIRSWQLHLGPLTWPEVLRQFALSAGFGPKLKKRNVERAFFRDDNEGHDGEDVISTLRNGSAVETAVALMRDKGFSHLRRSRHRLTPGTVKFAAFHVLSLEGSRGLTILEVADKIQKSGLRDLTTSKTPEASIAAALSRDSKLFERTAPSTYCVKPQFRKNPLDAESILAAAREKIRVFENGLSDSEEAEKDVEEADEAERDDDSDSEGAEDLEVDDQEENLSKEDQCQLSNGGNTIGVMSSRLGFMKVDIKDAAASSAAESNNHEPGSIDPFGEIDESNAGEPWVEGLMEGEYSDLSVEERLNALVSLIAIALEGNSIRIVLEDRLEAATALKKQMWAEAQLDKRRMKEEYLTKLQYSSFVGGTRSEGLPTTAAAASEGAHSPLINMDIKNAEITNEASDVNNDATPVQQYAFAAEKSRSQLKSYIGHRAEEMYVYRSLALGQDRRRNRYWQFAASASGYDPGSGRIFFESKDGRWRLIDSEETFDALLASLDTRGIRESYLHSVLTKMEASFKEALRSRSKQGDGGGCSSSSPEESPRSTVCYAGSTDMADASTSFKLELSRNGTEKKAALTRYQDFRQWSWTESFKSSALCAVKYGKKRGSELLGTCHTCCECFLYAEEECPSCVDQSFTKDSKSTLGLPRPVRIQLLKAQLSLIEASIPSEALQPIWTAEYRRSWGQRLQSSSTPEELLQLLTRLEGGVSRDFLSSGYETTNELGCSGGGGGGGGGSCRGGSGGATAAQAVDPPPICEPVPVLPWLPLTTAAVALRLMEFDAAVSYVLHQKVEPLDDQEPGDFMTIPSRFAFVKNTPEMEATEFVEAPSYNQSQEGAWPALPAASGRGRGRGSRGRGSRGRGRGGRRSSSAVISRSSLFSDDLPINGDKAPARRQARRGRGRGRGRGGSKRGRRGGAPARLRGYGRSGSGGRGSAARVSAVERVVEPESSSSGGEEWILAPAVREEEDEQSSEYDEQGDEYPASFGGEAAAAAAEEELMMDEEDGSEEDYDVEMDSRDDGDEDGGDDEEDDGDAEDDQEEEEASSYSEYSDD